MRTLGFVFTCLFVVVPAAFFPSPALTAPNVHVSERETVHLRFRCLTAALVDAPADGTFGFELHPERGGNQQFEVRWPGETSTSRVTLIATALPPQAGWETRIRLEGRVVLPDGRRREASRDLAFTGSTTALFELARIEEQALTLAVEAESVTETVVSARPVVGPPVVMHIEVEWLEDEQVISLESNRLSTFVGEAVSYSFRLGETGTAVALELRLIPQKIFGDVIQVRAEISGSIPRADRLELVSRGQRWMISRGQSSSIDVATGEPPIGFRFVVTPEF